MTKEEFIALTGENPEDMLGGDWENLLQEWVDNNYEGQP